MKFYIIIILFLFTAVGLKAADHSELIKKLGADSYKERKEAQNQLIEKGLKNKLILESCLKRYKTTKDPEIKDRLNTVLFSLAKQWVLEKPKPFMGIQFSQEVMAVDKAFAFRLTMVIDGTSAAKAGLQVGDMVTKIADLKITAETDSEQFIRQITRLQVGDEIKIRYLRNGKQK